ncbi:MAG: hypothetical protein R2773_00180 [Flavobacteriaceae bacterium]
MEALLQTGPFVTKVSFRLLKETYLELQQSADPSTQKVVAQALELFEKEPSLESGYHTQKAFDKHKKQIDELMACLFPPALTLNEIKVAVFPFSNIIFYESDRLKNIRANAQSNVDQDIWDLFVEDGYDFNFLAYAIVLARHYQYQIDLSRPIHVKVLQKDGNEKTYRATFNADFIDLYPNESAIEITEAIFDELMADPYNPQNWAKYFPEGSWTIEGFGILNLIDVSKDEQIDLFKTHLIQPNTETSMAKIVSDIQDIFGFEDLRVGSYQVRNNQILPSYKDSILSISIGPQQSIPCKDYACDFVEDQLFQIRKPVVLSSVESYHHASGGNHLSKMLLEQGLKSVILLPIFVNEEFSIVVEVASKIKNQLNAINLLKLEPIIPFIQSYARRTHEEFENQVSAIIQRECTSIHPSVEWRFQEEALRYLQVTQQGKQPTFHEITFQNVLPLYGQIDIKGSSDARNDAIQKDLMQQLNLSRDILMTLISEKELPYYEQLVFHIDQHLTKLKKGFHSNTEQHTQNFFQKELLPLFQHLKKTQGNLTALNTFFKKFDHDTQSIYEARKMYDETVDAINNELSEFIEAKQLLAQEIFPHYFEKYKTDGVEHNMYVGQSITQQETYHITDLYNLRLWQLQVMCEMEALFYQNQEQFPIQLQVASMIFVYDVPITIRYRIDEKQFDVDGAYNVRYEMIKKRIDKARIKNSEVRLAQPQKLCIVFSNRLIEREYLKYLEFLQSKKYIGSNIEVVDVEELQGASGMKAILAEINLNLKQSSRLFSIKDLEVVE